jgi:hypothetical protein
LGTRVPLRTAVSPAKRLGFLKPSDEKRFTFTTFHNPRRKKEMTRGNTNRFGSLKVLATAAAVTCFAGSAMATTITFASFGETNSSQQQWSIATSLSPSLQETVTASGAVMFTFSGISGLPFTGAEAATFTLHATSTSEPTCGTDCSSGSSVTDHGYSGTFSIIDNGVVKGANLLSGTFSVTGSPTTTGAQFGSSNIGGSSAQFDASATPTNLSQLVLTSQYVVFSPSTTLEDASFALSSVNPSIFVTNITQPTPGNFMADLGPLFGASGVGTFSSDVVPTGIPEPATFGVIGGGLLSLGLWRRKRILATDKN